ncbi:hypothetical protein C5167_024258 [Papaver somniferum]|uniref:Uncharacterized protein n=1 Tax=Papaver somniferum TaxID=3469 RepID=A0A4Y7JRX7_PAPSO|nr:protein DMP3-like [Papaver somniferum]RZC62499.1 hypothetical protein C5167_024258 [Papaver somniferum]
MSFRTRTKSGKHLLSNKIKNEQQQQQGKDDDVQIQNEPSFSQKAIAQTLTTTANLANLLPTGTILVFQLLTPVFTNNGDCDALTRLMTQVLLISIAGACFLASFTDSYRSPDGKLYYGFATFKGIWFFDCYPETDSSNLPEVSKYKLRFIDGVHAVLSVLVFMAVALRDKNVVNCFYPLPEHGTQQILNIIPTAVGVICSSLFVVFPTRRHGIGYPVSSSH